MKHIKRFNESIKDRKDLIEMAKSTFEIIDDEYHLERFKCVGMPVHKNPLEEIEIYIKVGLEELEATGKFKNEDMWDYFSNLLISQIKEYQSKSGLTFSSFISHYGSKTFWMNVEEDGKFTSGNGNDYSSIPSGNWESNIRKMIENAGIENYDLEVNIYFRVDETS